MTLKKPDELFEEKIKVETPVKVEELQREGTLKKPGELFGEKIKDETPVKVEEVQKQTDTVSSSFASSVEYSEKLNKFNHKIDALKEEINIKLDGLEKFDQSLKGEIGVVECRQQTINQNVIKEVKNLLFGDVSDNIKRLDEKIEDLRESYEQTLNEGLLNEPPSTDNKDPLTPTDQKFATLDDLNNHYQLFLNRIQQQLSTLGGGGAVNIRDLDDVDQSTARVNDKYLKYDSSSSKWVGADASGGGSGIGTDNVSTSTLNVVGVSTFNEDVKFTGNNTNARWNHDTSDLTLWNNTRLVFGDNEDFEIWHGGSHTFMKNSGGDLRIRGDVIKLAREDSTETYLEANKNQDVKLFYNGNEKFATTLEGVSVTGLTTTTNLYVTGVSTFSHNIVAENRVTVEGEIYVDSNIRHTGDTDTYIEFNDDKIRLMAGGKGILTVQESSVDTLVVNDGGNNCDFRVEGLNDENLIFSDGGTDLVGIGTAIPGAKLDVSGTLNVSGIATFRNGVNLLGLLHTNDNVNFTGQNYNLSWDKSDNALEFTDNAKATFGAGTDLEIYSNGTKGIVGGAVSFTSDVTVGTSQAVGVVLTSPNGTKYRLVVANDGTLSTTAV